MAADCVEVCMVVDSMAAVGMGTDGMVGDN